MTANILPFNPLDKKNLAASVAEALLKSEVHPLSKLPSFNGSGIYAIYYSGDFPAYNKITQLNCESKFELPIYVGKAVPSGSRKGGLLKEGVDKSLYKRLKEHSESISAASNLDLDHFFCRYLVVDDIWIPLGESLMIAKFSPLWNKIIDGFGNHDPGRGRHNGMRPRWDVLHPGRSWSDKLAERPESASRISEDAAQYLETQLV